jgi:hypothetical protein
VSSVVKLAQESCDFSRMPPRALPPRDGPFIKNRFRSALGLKPF